MILEASLKVETASCGCRVPLPIKSNNVRQKGSQARPESQIEQPNGLSLCNQKLKRRSPLCRSDVIPRTAMPSRSVPPKVRCLIWNYDNYLWGPVGPWAPYTSLKLW